MEMRASRKTGFWISIAVLIAVSIGFHFLNRGIKVRIRNSDAWTLRSVVIHVTGSSHTVGDLAPGSVRTVRVHPKGESHVEIQFRDAAGNAKTLNAGGYFEPGWRGSMDVNLNADGILSVESKVTP